MRAEAVVPPAAETNVPPSVATSRSFFRNHDYLCDVKPRQIIYRGELKCPFDSEKESLNTRKNITQ